jgi:hypothetical protein
LFEEESIFVHKIYDIAGAKSLLVLGISAALHSFRVKLFADPPRARVPSRLESYG